MTHIAIEVEAVPPSAQKQFFMKRKTAKGMNQDELSIWECLSVSVFKDGVQSSVSTKVNT